MQDLIRSIERSFVRKGIVILAFVLCATALKAETPAYVIHYLPTLGGASSTAAALNFGATGINASGEVTGGSAITGDAESHAFLSGSNGGALKDLGTLGGSTRWGGAINSIGQVVGSSYLAGNTVVHAFVSDPEGGALTDLGVLPVGTTSRADAINNLARSSVMEDLPEAIEAERFFTRP